MKKFLLAVTALFLVSAVFAQDVASKRNMNTVAKEKTIMTGREEAAPQTPAPMVRSVSRNFLGTTFYDLQTNGSMAPKLYAHNDGTVSAVWTTMGAASSSRGTGYNYYNGTSWVNSSSSTDRIETVRTGWGTMTCIGNAEIMASHNGTTALVIGICPQKGTQDWTFTTLQGPAVSNGSSTSTCLLWPAIASTGNTVHLICCTESDDGYLYQGIQTCLLYYRGTFNASSNTIDWEQPRIVGNVTSAEVKSFSGDAYAIAAEGNTVAIVNAPTFSDVFLWKSTDGGVNFTKTIIFEHPYAAYDPNSTIVADTPYVSDGSCAVALDDNGMAHVAFGLTRFNHDESNIASGNYSYYPGVVGMLYWNESMQPIINTNAYTLEPENIEAAGYKVFYRSDLNNDGGAYWSSGDVDLPGYGTGAVSMPQIVAQNGKVYMIYAAILDWPFLDVNNGAAAYYRGVFGCQSTDNGNTWGDVSWLSYNKDCYYLDDWSWVSDTDSVMVHAMANLYIDGESVFPAVTPQIVNGKVYITWQQDFFAGTYVKDGGTFAESYIHLLKMDADSIGVYNNTNEVWQGIWIDHTGLSNKVISGMKMYPNPASDLVNVTFSSEESANAVLSVMNLMGQTVYTENVDIHEGYNMVKVPVNNFRSGVYMVNLKTNKGTSTQKLIVR